LRNQNDPQIALRLRQQIDGYAAPPIASYSRDATGEWSDNQTHQLK
jgi:hypothetical protein